MKYSRPGKGTESTTRTIKDLEKLLCKAMTLHPGKEGSGTDVYKNTAAQRREGRGNNQSLSPQRAMVHQTELAGGRLSANEW